MGITHFVSDSSVLDIIPITYVKMVPVISKDLLKEKTVTRQEQLLEIEQIVVKDKAGARGISFGLLDGGKKWRLSDSNFKREIIIAGMGWGHLPEHTIQQELKDGQLIPLHFEDIYPRDLVINLIRLKKHQFGVAARSLWDELAALHQG